MNIIRKGHRSNLTFYQNFKSVLVLGTMTIILVLGFISPLWAEDLFNFSIKYDVSVAHVPIGLASLVAIGSDREYHLKFSTELTGLPSLLFASKITAISDGQIKKDVLYPSHYSFYIDYPQDPMRIEMTMADGAVINSTVAPPLPKRADRVLVFPEHLQNIIDPLSAFLVPYKQQLNADQICNQVANIFDGSARFDILFKPQGEKVKEIDIYNGVSVKCNLRYSPISGHQERQTNVKFMKNNRDIYVDLIPISGGRFLAPVGIEVATAIGNLRLKAVKLKGF